MEPECHEKSLGCVFVGRGTLTTLLKYWWALHSSGRKEPLSSTCSEMLLAFAGCVK
jgi:hypothetical protein